MSKSTFEEELKEKGILIYRNVGTSMLPLIRQGKDVMIIQRPEEWKKKRHKLEKFDVPLYRRKNGQYVLHRVVKVTDKGYVLRGDNTYSNEYGITDEEILGILTGIIRNGKEVSVSSYGYKLYVYIWYYTYYIRKAVIMIKRKMMK